MSGALDVGTIYGGIELDNREFRRVLRDSKADMAKAALDMQRMSNVKLNKDEWKSLTGQMKALQARAKETRDALLATNIKSDNGQALMRELRGIEQRLRIVKGAAEPMRKELERITKAEGDAAREAKHMSDAHGGASKSAKTLTAILGTLGGPAGRIGQAAAFGGGYAALGAASAIGIGSAIALGKVAVDADMRMDSLRRGLEQTMGSAAATEIELKKLDEVAKLPGLGLEEAAQGSLNLQAVGEKADEARGILMAFGNALATVGKGKDELAGVEEQIMQMLSKGKVMTEDVRIIRSYVPQLSAAMKAAFGTANAEDIGKMGVSAKEFVDKIVIELNKLPMMTSGVKNAFENMSDASTKAFASLGKTIEPEVIAVAGAVEKAANAIANLSDTERRWLVITLGIAAAVTPVALGVKILKDAYSALGAVREIAAAASAKNTIATISDTAATAADTMVKSANTKAIAANAAARAISGNGQMSFAFTKIFDLEAQGISKLLKADSEAFFKFKPMTGLANLATRAVEGFRSVVLRLPSATSVGIAAVAAFGLEYAHLKNEIKDAQDAMNHLNDDIPQRSKRVLDTPFTNSGEKTQLKQYIKEIKDQRTQSYDAVREVLESRFGETAVKDALVKSKDNITKATQELEKINLKRGTGVYKGTYYTDETLQSMQDQKFAELRRLTQLVEHKKEELQSRQAATTKENAPETEAVDEATKELEKMRRELFLNGDTAEAIAMQWEILNGEYAKAPANIKAQLVAMAQEIDLQSKARDAAKEHADMLKKASDEVLKMKQELYLIGASLTSDGNETRKAAMEWAILNGEYAKAPENIKKQLLALAEEIDLQNDAKNIVKEHAEEQKKLAEEQKRAADQLAGQYVDKMKESIDNLRKWAGEFASTMKSFADEVVDTVKDQLKREQDARDQAAEVAKSKYETLSNLGAAGMAAVTNVVMFKKEKIEKDPTLADFTPERIKSAEEEVARRNKEEKQIAERVQTTLFGNAISRYESYSKQQNPTLLNSDNATLVNIFSQLLQTSIGQLSELMKLNSPLAGQLQSEVSL